MNHKKSYPSVEAAMRSKAALKPGAWIDEYCPCGQVHVTQAKAAKHAGPSDAVRSLVLRRDGYRCVRCGKSVTGRPFSIHHRKLRSQGGQHTPDSLITLCGSGTTGCHGWVHGHVKASRDAGWIVSGSADPALISVEVISEHGSGLSPWLTASGGYRFTDPRTEVAA